MKKFLEFFEIKMMNKSTQTLLAELRKKQVSVATVASYLDMDDNVRTYGLESFVGLLAEHNEEFLSEDLVRHLIDVIEKSVRNPNYPKVDWVEIWRSVDSVTPDEWRAIQDELRANYNNIKNLIKAAPVWQVETAIGGAIAIIAHTAYHLGEMRQALCIIRN